MDQFGVLVENYGIKPQGKSAPMASVKSGAKTHNAKPADSWNSTYDSASQSKSILDDDDDPFNFSSGTRFQQRNDGGFSDFDFGFPSPPQNRTFASKTNGSGSGSTFDVELMFRDSMNLGLKSSNPNDNDDLLSGFSGKSSGHSDNDDLLSSVPKEVDPIDDIFGNLGGNGSVSGGSISRGDGIKGSNEFDGGDELIPGFGRATNPNRGVKQNIKMSKQEPVEANFIDTDISSDNGGLHGVKDEENSDWDFKAAAPADPQVDLDSFLAGHGGKHGAQAPAVASKVEIDSFFSVPKSSTTRFSEKQMPAKKTEVDIDSLFGAPNVKSDSRSTRAKSKNQAVPDLFPGTSSHSRNNFSSSSAAYDFGSVFGGPMTSSAFEEIEGENDERRRARFERYQRTEARMAQAVQDMNNREYQAQLERDERHGIAEIKDTEMKLWAAGKEGNLRALLSSLDQVLWPECGWKPLSLTDLITSPQVKVAYKKAALCVHPDKVQQKGADVQQKYVAEKVFDLLKEAWNKFNKEELR